MTNFYKFLKMCSRNAHISYPYTIQQNENILIFDIDQCLYKSKDLEDHEHSSVKKTFLEITNGTEDHWESAFSSRKLFKELFFHHCKLSIKDFDAKYDTIEFHKFILPDNDLVDVLKKIEYKKFCFTNGSETRARKILSILKIDHLIECIFCTDDEDTEFYAKPAENAYLFVENCLGIKNTKNIHFFDDSEKNVKAALKRGWNAYIVEHDIKNVLSRICTDNIMTSN